MGSTSVHHDLGNRLQRPTESPWSADQEIAVIIQCCQSRWVARRRSLQSLHVIRAALIQIPKISHVVQDNPCLAGNNSTPKQHSKSLRGRNGVTFSIDYTKMKRVS